MPIEPTSEIYLLQNCPLPASMEHTLYWSSEAAQTAYFQGLARQIIPVTDYSYIRTGRPRIKFGQGIAWFTETNYLMFRNSSYENKWFYAFVTQVEYINDVTTAVYFEIDPIQTWFFEMDLKPCMIERQHTETDLVGDNIVPEPFNVEPSICNKETSFELLRTLSIVVAVSATLEGEAGAWTTTPVVGTYAGGTYAGLDYKYYSLNAEGATAVSNMLLAYNQAGAIDSVVGIAIIPTMCGLFDNSNTATYQHSVAPYTSGPLDRYTPKNNKLYTAPYNTLLVKNNAGDTMELRWEYFARAQQGDVPTFNIIGTTGLNPSITCFPSEYAGVTLDLNHAITIKDWPLCSWNYDTYIAYVAQNYNTLTAENIWGMLKGVGYGAQAALGWYNQARYGDILNNLPGFSQGELSSVSSFQSTISNMGNVAGASSVGGVAGELEKATTKIAQLSDLDKLAPTTKGTATSDAVATYGLRTFWFQCMSINASQARILDDYFTMYGYQINRVATPKLNARPQYTYIKTVNCRVGGSFATNYERAIEGIFNRGITFWNTPANLGDYSVENRPGMGLS